MLPDGTKALAPSGAAVVGQEIEARSGGPGSADAESARRHPGDPTRQHEFAYMRQTVRTNNAAVVAEGAVKPTSGLHRQQDPQQPGGHCPLERGDSARSRSRAARAADVPGDSSVDRSPAP